MFAVLGIAVASSRDAEEDPAHFICQSDPLHSSLPALAPRKAQREWWLHESSKRTPKNLVKMRQGYRDYITKTKLEFENYPDKN